MNRIMKRIICYLLVAMMALLIPSNLVFSANYVDNPEIEQTINQFVAENQATTAAMSVSIFNNNQVLFEEAYGYINIAQQIENDLDAVFEWGSAGKLLVYVSVLQLAEQGLLDLDRDVRTILPEGFLTKLSYDAPITMMHLLNHTAGFQEWFVELFIPQGREIRSLEESLRVLQPPQIFPPGRYSGYSNFGTTLAAYIVEIISEQPFYEYVHENIFTPLGMTHTALTPDLMDNPWVRSQREQVQCYTGTLAPLGTSSLMIQWYPAGMATGTVSDFRKFAQGLLLNDDGLIPLFQEPETIERFHQATLYFPDGVTGRNYHGFLSEPWLEGHVIGHGGNTAGMSAQLAIDIENNFGAVIMTNQAGEIIYCRQMLGEIFGRRDLSEFDNSANDGLVNGLFRSTRTFDRGIFRIASLMGVMPIIGTEDDDGGPISKVAPGVFFLEEGSFLIFANVGDDGRVDSLSMIFMSFVRSSWAGLILELVMLLLLIIAALYGLIGLIITLIRRLGKKEQVLTLIRIGIYTSSLFVVANTVFMIVGGMSMFLTRTLVIVCGVLYILSALVILTCYGGLFSQVKKLELLKKQKRQIFVTVLMGAFVIVNLLYWQMWMFWV